MVVLLIDAMNVIRRVHAAMDGKPYQDDPEAISASSLASFNRALRDVDATHAGLFLECDGANWRHDIYPDYKAHRPPCPEAVVESIGLITTALEAQGVCTVKRENMEADDTIAAATVGLRAAELKTIVLSTDKDLCQLLVNGTMIRNHFSKEYRDADWVRNKFYVEPHQLRDALALMGDSSDNVPGVPGVGSKTAGKWLNEYGSLEGVIENADNIKGKIGERLRANIDMARLSYELVGLKSDFDLGLTLKDMRLTKD